MIERTLNNDLLVAGLKLAGKGVALSVGVHGCHDNGVLVRGVDALNKEVRLIMPICLNNSYWSKRRVEMLVAAHAVFGNETVVLVADGPAQHNYAALGHTPSVIKSEVSACARQLTNRLNSATSALDSVDGAKFTRWSWSDIAVHETWQQQRRQLSDLFDNSDEFRADVLSASNSILNRHYASAGKKHSNFPANALRIAANYTLDEIAAFGASAELLDVRKTCLVYHKRWEVFENWANGRYDGKVADRVGLVILHVDSVGENGLPIIANVDEVSRESVTVKRIHDANEVLKPRLASDAGSTFIARATDKIQYTKMLVADLMNRSVRYAA